ncbi:MAG: 3'-5' exonuclease, partial [Bacteroidetes bacterium]|nr:3'-5' exonuclease [Bacteroidota bacterium]
MSNYFQSDIPLNQAEFCVLDTETTGLAAGRNNIIEIGIVVVKNLKISEKYHSMINPGRHIPANITMITGITNKEVEDAPFFEDIAN